MPLPFRQQIVGSFLWGLASCFLAVFAWSIWNRRRPQDRHSVRTVAILVLGDIGRSPRMMYHTQSFVQNGFAADLIGYGGSKPIASLERHRGLRLHHLPEPPRFLRLLPFIAAAPIKIVHQVISIVVVFLWYIKVAPNFILVQNPPSIPSLILVQVIARLRGSQVIIDWHNLGYTILAMRLGQNHPLVRISMWLEGTFGGSAYAHLFVTNAMRDALLEKWALQGRTVVLHDRPPKHFHRCSAQEVHELFQRLDPIIRSNSNKALSDFLPKFTLPHSTALTHVVSLSPTTLSTSAVNFPKARLHTDPPLLEDAPVFSESESGLPSLRPNRPALVVSSTSWTADEDFSILFEALEIYEKTACESAVKLPRLLVVITGKGPLREKHMTDIGRRQVSWSYVRCISLWLAAEDYPILLGSADLGVCLHASSSALDLPMKVVDMFGCGLPVCALDFACISELILDRKNGFIFETAPQLAQLFKTLFNTFPDTPRIDEMRRSFTGASSYRQRENLNEKSENWRSWDDNWNRIMRPLIVEDVNLQTHCLR